MSNSLSIKSKYLLGVMIVTAVVFAFAFATFATKADAACSINSTLRLGSTGAEVVCLQTALGGLTADGNFGPLTRAAVMSFQSNSGLVADGVFGPMSRAVWLANNSGMGGTFPAGCTSAVGFSTTTGMSCAGDTTLPAGCTSTSGYSVTTGMSCSVTSDLPAGCSSTSGFSPTTGMSCSGGSSPSTPTGPLAGTNGEISDINQLSQYSAEEVGEGSNDVKVLGFDVEASKDGDIRLSTLKLTFDSNGNNAADSDRIADYLDSLTVWMGSTEVGSANLDDFNKDSTGVYSKTIALSGAVVRMDTTEKFYVSVDAVNNLDSGDIDSDSWTIAINSLRFEDGSGVVTTVGSGDALLTGNMDYDAAGDGVPIAFVSFSTASDTELKISLDTASPEAGVIEVDTTDDTEGVVLLKGKLKLTGDSDVWLDELPITLTSTGDSISALTSSITLSIDGQEFTESTGANCIDDTDFSGADDCDAATTAGVIFDNLDMTLTAGETIEFTVSADVNDTNNSGVAATDFDEGDTLLASLTTVGRAAMVVENSAGDSLTDGTERTGSATGLAQAFYTTGIRVELVGTPTAVISNDGDPASATSAQTGTFTIKFSVTAFGDDMRIDDDPIIDTAAFTTVTQLSYSLSGAGTDTPSLVTTTAATHDTESFLVEEDQTESFTLTVAQTPTSSTFSTLKLEGIGWTAGSADAVGANIYTFNLDDFHTPDLYMIEYD